VKADLQGLPVNTCIEKAHFPMKYMNITQGVNGSYSHKGTNAIDLAGKDSKIDNVFAPFTGIIKKIYTKNGNFVWLESCDKVQYADGTIDYMTVIKWTGLSRHFFNIL